MAILNITPDSFSDGGRFFSIQDAVRAGLQMADDGADILDVGGESTRPGASPVTEEEEQQRILPVIGALAARGLLVSVDTRNCQTMRAALDAGARIVNDVSGLSFDEHARKFLSSHECGVVIMHTRGVPETMNSLIEYRDVAGDVRSELMTSVAAALEAGIAPERIAIDPGFGFAKDAQQSLLLLQHLREFAHTGFPTLVGVSRKSFIGHLSKQSDPVLRLGGSIAAELFAISQGASILRVHDVRETAEAVRVWQSLCN